MLKKNNRLKKKKEFNYIYKKGQVAHSQSFSMHLINKEKENLLKQNASEKENKDNNALLIKQKLENM